MIKLSGAAVLAIDLLILAGCGARRTESRGAGSTLGTKAFAVGAPVSSGLVGHGWRARNS